MKILVLNGVKCTNKIWEQIVPFLNVYEIEYMEYSHEITKKIKEILELAKWVFENCHSKSYDVVIGHSLGGLIALQLRCDYSVKFKKIICLDTNLKPAKQFYRNLMTKENMIKYGEFITNMFEEEAKYYDKEFFHTFQVDFDYTHYLKNITAQIYVIYGDRGLPKYENKLSDLNLDDKILNKIQIRFISNSCHMMMMENPQELQKV